MLASAEQAFSKSEVASGRLERVFQERRRLHEENQSSQMVLHLAKEMEQVERGVISAPSGGGQRTAALLNRPLAVFDFQFI